MCLRRPFESIAVSVIFALAMRVTALRVGSKAMVLKVLSGRVTVNAPVESKCVIVPSRVGVSASFLWWMITFLLSRLLLFMFCMVGGSPLWEVIPIVSSCFDVISQVSSLVAAMAGRRSMYLDPWTLMFRQPSMVTIACAVFGGFCVGFPYCAEVIRVDQGFD